MTKKNSKKPSDIKVKTDEYFDYCIVTDNSARPTVLRGTKKHIMDNLAAHDSSTNPRACIIEFKDTFVLEVTEKLVKL